MKRKLKDFEKELLTSGNCYAFGLLLLEFYPKESERIGIDARKVQNRYQAIFDFNDGIYTVWGNDDVKYFFDVEMNCKGSKC